MCVLNCPRFFPLFILSEPKRECLRLTVFCLPHRLMIANVLAVLLLFSQKVPDFQRKSNATSICTLSLETCEQQRGSAHVFQSVNQTLREWSLKKMACMVLVRKK